MEGYDWVYIIIGILYVYLWRIGLCQKHWNRLFDELSNADLTIKQWKYLCSKMPSPYFMALMFHKWTYKQFFKVNL